MTEHTKMPSYSYSLATGGAAAQRLALLNTVYGAEAERILAQINMPVGGRVVDFGCGTGSTLPWFSNKVGACGEVVGLDASSEQLGIARQSCSDLGLNNVRFVEASAYQSGLERGSFDVAHCRLLLCHLQRPMDALREMASLLRPGGVVICFDLDLKGLHSIPRTDCYETLREVYLERRKDDGLDNDLNSHLPAMMRDLDLIDIEMASLHPTYFQGEKKRLWEYTFAESKARTLEKKLLTVEAFDKLMADVSNVGHDENTAVAQAIMPVCWARKKK